MEPVLQVRDLSIRFGGAVAVSGASLDLYPGETLGVVGESGSGKTVTGLAIMRLLGFGSAPPRVEGSILLRRDGRVVDLMGLEEAEMRKVRGADISMIFQEPLTSLNPVYTVGEQVAESIRLHRGLGGRAAFEAAIEMFDLVRIPDARRRATEYPHQLSGGMRQRVMIAMALACEPKVLIADEPTTALDVTIQAQVLTLMTDLQKQLGTSVMFITHDMAVVGEIADRVVVMQRSKIVEQGTVEEVFNHPRTAYARHLLAVVPRLGSMAGLDQPARFQVAMEIGEQ